MRSLNHYVVKGDDSHVEGSVLILHGILGSAKNWRGFCRRFAKVQSGWHFILPDLRHHGESSGFDGPNTVQACVDDLLSLCRAEGFEPKVIIGHSFGGKVALELAAQATWSVESVWALDTPPGLRGAGARGPGSEVGHVISTLGKIEVPSPSRERIDEALERAGFSTAMRGWMTTNLRRSDGGFVWCFELSAIEELIDDYFALDLWPKLRGWKSKARVNLLAAERGGRWSANDRTQAMVGHRAGTLAYHVLAGAGHWVHVDAPDELQGLLGADLEQVARKMA